MTMYLRPGDLVCYAVFKSDPRFRLGLVMNINYTMGLIKVKWCDGHVSLHSEMFLKRIA
jgi:hypothetical protein